LFYFFAEGGAGGVFLLIWPPDLLGDENLDSNNKMSDDTLDLRWASTTFTLELGYWQSGSNPCEALWSNVNDHTSSAPSVGFLYFL